MLGSNAFGWAYLGQGFSGSSVTGLSPPFITSKTTFFAPRVMYGGEQDPPFIPSVTVVRAPAVRLSSPQSFIASKTVVYVPAHVGINRAVVSQTAWEVLRSPPPRVRVSQLALEVLRERPPERAGMSQMTAEVLRDRPPQSRAFMSQITIEVLGAYPPPGKARFSAEFV